MTREDVARVAKECKGTRFVHQAAKKGVGMNCIGLLIVISNELDLPDKFDPNSSRGARFKGYGKEPDAALLDDACQEYLDEIPVVRAGLGDIYRMRWNLDKVARHFGVISSVDPIRVVHAHQGMRKVIETSLPIAGATIVRAFRFRGVE